MCRPDHLPPLFRLVGDNVGKIGWGARHQDPAQLGQPSPHPGVAQRIVHGIVEGADRVVRCKSWRTQSEPVADFIARQEFRHYGRFGQGFGLGRGRDRQRPQPARLDVLDRRADRVKHHLHLAADKIGQGRPGTAVRHMCHLYAGHRLEQLSGHVVGRTYPRRGEVDFRGIVSGILNELGNGLCRK